MKTFTYTFIFFAILNIDWIKQVEKTIDQIDRNATQVDRTEMKEKDAKSILSQSKFDDFSKMALEYAHGDLMDIAVNYYAKDDFIFAHFVKGKEVILYKRQKRENDPVSILIESKTYFKNEKEGIRKSRQIKVHTNDNIESLNLQLQKKEFETHILNYEDYQRMKKDYLKLKTKK